MLSDLIARLTTPIAPPLRAMGYLDESLAMRRRARRNAVSWKPHLALTRQFVLSAAEQCRNREQAIILGSGLLLDVPLEELSGMFRTVVLMDVVCLPEVRKAVTRHPNAVFVEHDVTGVAAPLFREGRSSQRLPQVALPPARIAEDAGLVISLNILSQLWVVPRLYAARRIRSLEGDRVDDWCAEIVEAHYRWLRSCSADVCLVADYEMIKRDRSGRSISRESTVYGLDLPQPDASWTWNIVPPGDRSQHVSKELIVGAWHFAGTQGTAGA
jgi:hypothetical protein